MPAAGVSRALVVAALFGRFEVDMTDEIDNTEDKQEAEVQTETIDDLFNDDAAPKEEAEESKGEEAPESKEAEESPEAKEEEKPAETPAAEEDKSVPVKALQEERKKRQAAEARLKELEGKFQPSEDKKVPDPVDDPEGYARFIQDQNNLDALRTKVSLSRDLMLDAKEDYAEKEQVFVELAKENPHLVEKMNASPNPAKFAYQTAVDHLETQKLRDPKYKEELKEQLRKELLEELKAEKPDKKSALDVPDLSKATAAGKNTDKGEKLLESVDEIEMPIDKA